jgi:hypothetical protein
MEVEWIAGKKQTAAYQIGEEKGKARAELPVAQE